MTGLERINQWLEYVAQELELPSHRREVARSGQNLEWLRKSVRKGYIPATDDIKALLAMDFKDLLK